MIKKEKDLELFFKTLGYSLKQIRIKLIEISHILGTLWNWSEN